MTRSKLAISLSVLLLVGVVLWNYGIAGIWVPALDSRECGAWGYRPADVNLDCHVDLNDLAEVAAGWLTCTDPNDPCCVQP